ncbi:MAG: efflux RND transporter periplasmic adaptor subunit [Candidatus Eiseniibacteriota bacterium]
MSEPKDDRIEALEQERARLAEERDRLQAQLDLSYAQLSEITSRVLAMSEASNSLVETHDATSAAAAALDVATRSVMARSGALFLSHGEGSFELLASIGFDEETREHLGVSLPDLALCNLAENEASTFDVAQAEESEAFAEWKAEALEADPEANLTPLLDLFVPLLLENRTIAVMAMGPAPGGEPYPEDARLFLDHVADQAALAIDRALLFEQNQNRLQDLDALLRISRELSSTLDVDHVLQTAVNLSGAIVERQRAVLALFEGQRLKIRAVSDFPRVDANTAERLGLEKLLEWIGFKKPDSLVVGLSEVEQNEDHPGRDVWLDYFKGEMRGALVLGLRDDQGPVGVLLLESYAEGQFDSESDREALGVLVGQLSVAIRNAELYRQLPMVSALTPLAERRRRWQRMSPARRRGILIAIGVGLLLVGAIPWPAAVGGDGRTLPANEVSVRAASTGIVRSVEARSGQRVLAGQRLAVLEPEGLAARLSTLRAEADHAQAAGGQAERGADPFARRMAELDREGAMARLAALERDNARSQLTAPVTGYVLTPNLAERAGTYLEAGEVFCQVSPLDTLRVEIGVSETDVARIRPGQTLRLKVLGYPDRQFRGRVTEVSWQGEPSRPGRPTVFKVLGFVANPGPTLRSGMTGRARVDVSPETLIVRWLRGVWRWLRMGFWL